MNKEKEIKLTETAIEDICPHAIQTSEYASGIGCSDRGVECDCFCHEACTIERTIKAGYRKADEVRKETAREILEYLRAVQEKDELKNCDLDWIAMQYGVEVDE